MNVTKRAHAIANALRKLERTAELAQETGLEPPSIDWALNHAFSSYTQDNLLTLHARATEAMGRSGSARSLGVVLAGNVFTAGCRDIVVGALLNMPVIVKPATGYASFPRLLTQSLLKEGFDSVTVREFDRDDADAFDQLATDVDALSVYGDDATVAAIRERVPESLCVTFHGHGLGVGVVDARALETKDASRALASQFATDIAAYDQRGCLSPHAIFVQGDGKAFANDLIEALHDHDRSMPRAPLPLQVGAAQIQWRGVAIAEGELTSGEGFAVALASHACFRPSPGYRNVQVLSFDELDEVRPHLANLGDALKALALTPALTTNDVRAGATSYVCAPGQMQMPPLDARLEGQQPWACVTLR